MNVRMTDRAVAYAKRRAARRDAMRRILANRARLDGVTIRELIEEGRRY